METHESSMQICLLNILLMLFVISVDVLLVLETFSEKLVYVFIY